MMYLLGFHLECLWFRLQIRNCSLVRKPLDGLLWLCALQGLFCLSNEDVQITLLICPVMEVF
ncbi:unnamed protein product [Meloidogyne enterolobii]|uniref:Uncharacterized protein n=1 Tax=Meloidogyne enterolobii TaxID=390850 RepID=A0ACB1AGI7_MELEN